MGITLDVLPRIGSDGSVRMEVKPTISAIASQSVQITEIARAPYINNRTAETTVICQDTQTVIIGGLITTTDRDHEDKIPILGDIPVAGLLFRSTTKVKERNELMIFLTPNILRTPADQKEAALREFKGNETLRIIKMNHDYKRSALNTVRDPELLHEIYRRPDALPETPYEQRMENIRQSIMELEMIPEQWRDESLPDHRPTEQEVE